MLICNFPVTLKPWHSLCISKNLLKLIIICGLVDVPYIQMLLLQLIYLFDLAHILIYTAVYTYCLKYEL